MPPPIPTPPRPLRRVAKASAASVPSVASVPFMALPLLALFAALTASVGAGAARAGEVLDGEGLCAQGKAMLLLNHDLQSGALKEVEYREKVGAVQARVARAVLRIDRAVLWKIDRHKSDTIYHAWACYDPKGKRYLTREQAETRDLQVETALVREPIAMGDTKATGAITEFAAQIPFYMEIRFTVPVPDAGKKKGGLLGGGAKKPPAGAPSTTTAPAPGGAPSAASAPDSTDPAAAAAALANVKVGDAIFIAGRLAEPQDWADGTFGIRQYFLRAELHDLLFKAESLPVQKPAPILLHIPEELRALAEERFGGVINTEPEAKLKAEIRKLEGSMRTKTVVVSDLQHVAGPGGKVDPKNPAYKGALWPAPKVEVAVTLKNYRGKGTPNVGGTLRPIKGIIDRITFPPCFWDATQMMDGTDFVIAIELVGVEPYDAKADASAAKKASRTPRATPGDGKSTGAKASVEAGAPASAPTASAPKRAADAKSAGALTAADEATTHADTESKTAEDSRTTTPAK